MKGSDVTVKTYPLRRNAAVQTKLFNNEVNIARYVLKTSTAKCKILVSQCANHTQWLKMNVFSSCTNGWPQQKIPELGFRTHIAAL